MVLLGQSQILPKQCSLRRRVVCKASKIEIGKGTTREEVPCKHLTNGLDVEAKSSDTGLSSKEQREDKGEYQCKQVAPAWKGRLNGTISSNLDREISHERPLP